MSRRAAAVAASGEAAFHTVVLLGAFYFLLLDRHVAVRWLSDVSPLRRGQPLLRAFLGQHHRRPIMHLPHDAVRGGGESHRAGSRGQIGPHPTASDDARPKDTGPSCRSYSGT